MMSTLFPFQWYCRALACSAKLGSCTMCKKADTGTSRSLWCSRFESWTLWQFFPSVEGLYKHYSVKFPTAELHKPHNPISGLCGPDSRSSPKLRFARLWSSFKFQTSWFQQSKVMPWWLCSSRLTTKRLGLSGIGAAHWAWLRQLEINVS